MQESINTYEVYQQLADNYNNMIDYKAHNAFYDRPNTLSLLPDVKGKRILDAGCGPGKYAEMLLTLGAEVIGIDFSDKMIIKAKERNNGNGQFRIHDLTKPVDFIEHGSIDVIICPLVLEYIKDWNDTLKEFHRILTDKGILIVSIQHPFFDYTYFKSNNYFEIEKVKSTWRGFGFPIEVECYRRSLQDSLNPFIENDFTIDRILEPKPLPEMKATDPVTYEELMQFPAFLHIRACRT